MQLANRILLYAVLAARIASPQTPPKIDGETANGNPIKPPDASANKVTVLILGFSKQGGRQTGPWEEHLSRDFAGDPHFATYTIAVLEGAPGLLRGMIKLGIRNGTPLLAKRDHMVITVSGEAAWKRFLGVSDSTVPYLVLLDAAGHTRWTGHGLFEARQYETLKAAVKDTGAAAAEK